MPDRTCSVDGCERPTLARGVCGAHYQRLRKEGRLPSAIRPSADGDCDVDGCDSPVLARGWCRMHYKRWTKNGDLGGAEPLRTSTPPPSSGLCSVDGCERPFMARGWCSLHYLRWKRARRLGVDTEPYAAKAIAERDGWCCQICRKTISRKLTWPHPRSLSMDHIIPLSLGGDDMKSNVNATHLVCNMRKNVRGSDQLRLIG